MVGALGRAKWETTRVLGRLSLFISPHFATLCTLATLMLTLCLMGVRVDCFTFDGFRDDR
jgi:hypothetical protein